jgi:hypothetical protein
MAAGSKMSRHLALPGREAVTRQSRKPLVYWVLRFCRTRLWFFLRDGIQRDGRIDFDRFSDDLNTDSQALASIHRATTVLSARRESQRACSASRKVLPLNNFCKELYLSFSSSAVAADFDCHQATHTGRFRLCLSPAALCRVCSALI